MCGITGLVNQEQQQHDLRVTIKKMNDLIQHRGPNDEGFFFDTNLALGHRRLSIIDLSQAGHQPMTYLNRYTITFNGEIYNYLELREQLIALGYAFVSHSDTEVILAAYAAWGEACVEHFNGMWAFAIYDCEAATFFCSRDRFGVKPFYYCEIGAYFAFGSEIKQFTHLPGWSAELDMAVAYDFLMHSWMNHTAQTFFKGVYQLQAGHNLIYSLKTHTFQVSKWYHLDARIKPSKLKFDAAKAEFLKLFETAVKLRLRSDVKVGSCLSGGMDSSAIVCMMHQILVAEAHTGSQETVSSCFEDKRFDEQEYIDAVIKDTQVNAHKVFSDFNDLFVELDNIIWHQDQPFGSTSVFAQWNVYKEAKHNDLRVMLDGQGADEHLTGYHGYYEAYFMALIKKGRFIKLFKEIAAYQRMHHYPVSKIIKILLNAPGLKTIKKLLKRTAKTAAAEPSWWVNSNAKGLGIKEMSAAADSIYQLSQKLLWFTSLPALLHFQDRDSMAFSVESREPFLDYHLVEFALSLPDDYKIHAGITKYILRQAMAGIVPQKVLNRYDKMGFVTPESAWMQAHAELFTDELALASERLKNYVNQEQVVADFKQALANKSIVMGSIYWRLICLGRWLKVFEVKMV